MPYLPTGIIEYEPFSRLSSGDKDFLERLFKNGVSFNQPSIPDTPEEWLDTFNTFSIYQVLPQLIELWRLNVKTDVESKKSSPN